MAFAVTFLFLTYLWLRYLIMDHMLVNWMAVCAVYVTLVGADEGWDDRTKVRHLLNYAACWPMSQIMGHFWIWDFRHFVVDRESMPIILDFFSQRAKLKGR